MASDLNQMSQYLNRLPQVDGKTNTHANLYYFQWWQSQFFALMSCSINNVIPRQYPIQFVVMSGQYKHYCLQSGLFLA